MLGEFSIPPKFSLRCWPPELAGPHWAGALAGIIAGMLIGILIELFFVRRMPATHRCRVPSASDGSACPSMWQSPNLG
ncbi:hypothetical protein MPL3356_510006 [Mesorhizobium plurifarium]|uniref:Uncharacterized protein n=1 Tax=Mesorhizobium plurifarium TaxID=69974 RepID=A0A090E6B2_MESPL|nr:hypothetical protein MPL3356_510006 [Mesorhizobium plurifarium]